MPRCPRFASRNLALLSVAVGIALSGAASAGSKSDNALQGLSGSNVAGLSGSNVAGLSGSNEAGLSGSNVAGLSGSNVAGLSGSNVAGLSGSNLAGLSGSNVAGLSGSNVAGLDRSNVRGLSGSNLQRSRGNNGRGLSGGTASPTRFGDGFVLAAMGRLDAVSNKGSAATFEVAGQSFSVSAEQASNFAVGDYVVAGAVRSDTAALVYHVGSPYVPGLSLVRLRGAIQSVDMATGQLAVGALVVDHTYQLSVEPTFAPAVGDTIEVRGIQPAPRGVLIAGQAVADRQ